MKTRITSNNQKITFVLLGMFLGSIMISGCMSLLVSDISSSYMDGVYESDAPSSSNYVGTQPAEKRTFNGVGEISISQLQINEYANPSISYDAFYPGPGQILGNWTVNRLAQTFLGTKNPANGERSTGNGDVRSSNVTVLMNETVRWTYWHNSTEYVIGYRPYIHPAVLENMFLNDSMLDKSQYMIFYDGEAGFYYDFEDLYNANENGTFRLTFEYSYDVPISLWSVSSTSAPYYLTKDNIQNQTDIVQDYQYSLTFGEETYNKNMTIRFDVNLPDANSIYNVDVDNLKFDGTSEKNALSLSENGGQWITYNETTKKFSMWINLNDPRTLSDITFSSNFSVEFLDVVDGYWFEDKLVESLYRRQRSYKISITDGPNDLKLNKIWLNDTSIIFNDLYDKTASRTSALGRKILIENMNYSLGRLPGTGLDDDSPQEYPEGISILGSDYYLWKDEVDVITFEYSALETLSFIIADEITNPITGVQVRIHRGNQLYGPRMSLYGTNPLAKQVTNHNGQIILNYVPRGEYTVEILDSNGNFVENKTATTNKPINILVTSITHFPSVILYLTALSAVITCAGLVIYKKKKD